MSADDLHPFEAIHGQQARRFTEMACATDAETYDQRCSRLDEEIGREPPTQADLLALVIVMLVSATLVVAGIALAGWAVWRLVR